MGRWVFAVPVPGGGLAFLVACLPCLLLSFLPPIPRPPSPVGKGESKLFHARGFAPCIPGAEPARHWERGRTTRPAGVCLVCRPPTPPLVYFFAPIPPTPFPGGEGGDSKIILPGASPPAPRHLTVCGTYRPCHTGAGRRWDEASPAPGGGLAPALPVDLAAVVLAGGLIFLVACQPCLLLSFLPPIPPTPFPGGEGGDQGYFMQGASPLASPALNRLRHWLNLRSRHPAVGLPRRCRLTLPLWYSQGSAPSLSPACPAFSLLFCPLSPLPPSPAGKGDQGYFMQGASPLASPGLNPRGTCTTKGFCLFTGGQCRQPRRGGTGGEELRRLRWSSPPGQG